MEAIANISITLNMVTKIYLATSLGAVDIKNMKTIFAITSGIRRITSLELLLISVV